MGGVAPGGSAAAFLLDEKERLAREITRRLYERLPGLQDKYGERGREKCLQDMRYNLEHLAPAVDLREPGLFAGYVRWLDGLLRARGVDTGELAVALEITEDVVVEGLEPEAGAPVAECIRAGSAVLESAA